LAENGITVSRGGPLGRKISIKERVATEAAQDIIKRTTNQSVKAQMVKLLFDSDAREKARADTHARQRQKRVQNRELDEMRSQIETLKGELQSKANLSASLDTDHKNEIALLQEKLASQQRSFGQLEEQRTNVQFAASESIQKASEQLSAVTSYLARPEYDRRILHRYLKEQNVTESETAALHVIVSDKSISKEQRRKLAIDITRDHKEARNQQPLKQFVDDVKAEFGFTKDEDLEPDYVRGYRDKACDDPLLLLKLATGEEDTSIHRRNWAGDMLRLFYGWTNLDVPGLERSYWDRQAFFKEIGALRKRSIEEVERNLQTEIQTKIENKRSKEDWQMLVKNDNQRARPLREAAAAGDSDALCELRDYRQCNNCAHVSHIDRTGQGHCHHCGRMYSGTQPMEWLPVVKLTELPYCAGLFPCMTI